MMLSGWGRFPEADCRVLAPRDLSRLPDLLATESSLIVRGNGRSYGDPALNPHATVSLRHADRFIAFDPLTGTLEAEAGILLPDIIETFLPRGWFVPVTPGTKFVSLGGMIAADVHGKNHHKAGSFGDHVESLQLMQADGRVLHCSDQENSELFHATRGGMGLTGIILSARVRLQKIESAYIRQQTLKVRGLEETMAAFENSRDWTYSVAWIDCFATGRNTGRALLYRGEHAKVGELPVQLRSKPFDIKPRKAKVVPFDFPAIALNRWSIGAFNTLYYAKGRTGTSIVDCDAYFYPLDAIHAWNRIYGRRGLVQYQCVLPKKASQRGLEAILARVARASSGSFLSVLKLLGPGRGMMSFPIEGYTLAMDFPATPSNLALMDELDAITVDHGGRIYLAKDARAGRATVQKGYEDWSKFTAMRRDEGSAAKFSSLLSERLSL